MRLTKIRLDGFGRLGDFEAEIAPGLHVIFGRNEAGKSHLQQAILALLYGFYEGNRARRSEIELQEYFRPWISQEYSGSLEYELDSGDHFRVTRNFKTSDLETSIWSLDTGLEVTNKFGRGSHGNVPFARTHLGMTKAVFRSCAFVSQGELIQMGAVAGASASPREIGDTIVRLADTAGLDISAQSALARLSDARRQMVGGPTARTTPLPVERSRLRELAAELANDDKIRESVAEDASRLDEIRSQRNARPREVARISYLLAQVDMVQLDRALKQLREMAIREETLDSIMQEHAEFARLPIEDRDEILKENRSAQDLGQAIDAMRSEVAEKREILARVDIDRQALSRRQGELSYLSELDAGGRPAIDELEVAWRQAWAVAAEAGSRLGAAEVKARDLLEEYESLVPVVGHLTSADLAELVRIARETQQSPGVWARIKSLLSWLRHQAIKLLRLARRSASRRDFRQPDASAKEAFVPASILPNTSGKRAEELLTLQGRFRDIAPLVERFREEQSLAEQASVKLDTAAQHLHGALTGLVEDLSDLSRAHSIYLERIAGYRELEETQARLSLAEKERSNCLRVITQFEENVQRYERQESRLRHRLEEATNQKGDLSALVQAFETYLRRGNLYGEADRELGEIGRMRSAVLGGRSPQELEESIQRSRRESDGLLLQHPWLSGAMTNETKEELQDKLRREQSDLKNYEIEIGQLSERVSSRLTEIRRRAVVEEEIAICKTEVTALERFGNELDVAIELTTEASNEAHREFGPKVGKFLSSGLAKVTNNRYRDAWIDPASLKITTEVPETGRLEDIARLSQGTRTAAYLLLRIGLAQHMSDMAESIPVILDDPLVDLDEPRVEQFMELLSELANGVQILLFTKDLAIVRWLENSGSRSDSHRVLLMPFLGKPN